MFKKKEKKVYYDKENQIPILKCSICNGEQVAGFKDSRTGKFEEVMLIRNQKDLDHFKELYGVKDIGKEY
ncbi:MAG: aspartate dehydrogenase [Lachnospiraceae bacterium]|nr:aspartate dehydrogenase [Lachnospiraceae bacterium]